MSGEGSFVLYDANGDPVEVHELRVQIAGGALIVEGSDFPPHKGRIVFSGTAEVEGVHIDRRKGGRNVATAIAKSDALAIQLLTAGAKPIAPPIPDAPDPGPQLPGTQARHAYTPPDSEEGTAGHCTECGELAANSVHYQEDADDEAKAAASWTEQQGNARKRRGKAPAEVSEEAPADA